MMATAQEAFVNDQAQRWQATLQRDGCYDSLFVYAVRTTGIYCRPSCPSRRPRREQVVFYDSPQDAGQAGFRPCKRCRPDQELSPGLAKVRLACRYIESHLDEALTLEKLGARVEMNPHHLQRAFKKALGVSPRQYADACRLRTFKDRLKEGADVSGALYGAGYGSSSRLYERSARQLGMTPATLGKGGQGTSICYAVVKSDLGHVLVAATAQGICQVMLGDGEAALQAALWQTYPQATIRKDSGALGKWVRTILEFIGGERVALDLPLDVQATAFQRRVWLELQKIPYGQTRSYAQIAHAIGRPQAVRAVAGACARNPAALITPCHRAVRSDGGAGGYRWGLARKLALLQRERRSAGERFTPSRQSIRRSGAGGRRRGPDNNG